MADLAAGVVNAEALAAKARVAAAESFIIDICWVWGNVAAGGGNNDDTPVLDGDYDASDEHVTYRVYVRTEWTRSIDLAACPPPHKKLRQANKQSRFPQTKDEDKQANHGRRRCRRRYSR